ncbi:retrovirus-related pol polyprotein from transposon TNT 1-94 [Tanacetum coccineum]
MATFITRFDIEKFNEKFDFGLWQIKMHALMVQQGCDVALETLLVDMHAEILTSLTSLYMKKSLSNRLYLKKKLYTYYMSPDMKLGDHIDEFNKLILDLANVNIEIEDEDQTLMLLTSLSSSYENFVETLTTEDVLVTLNSRELKKRTEGTKEENSDGLYVRGMSYHSGKSHPGGISRYKSRGETSKLKCFICHSEGHLKRGCLMKKSSGSVRKGKHDQDFDSFDDEGNAYFGEALVVVRNRGGSYHMTHRMDFLYDFKGFGGGSDQLDDKRTCTKRIGKVKRRLHDESSFVLEDVRAENKKVKESMEANLGKLLKYNAWST